MFIGNSNVESVETLGKSNQNDRGDGGELIDETGDRKEVKNEDRPVIEKY